MKDFIDFFKKYSIEEKYSIDEIKSIGKLIKVQKIKKGEKVFSENDRGRFLYIVRKGKLEMKRGEMLLGFFEAGDFFGEVALINDQLRYGTVTAIEDSVLLALDGNDILYENKLPAGLVLKIVRELARKVTSYLRTPSYTKTTTLIKEGEGEHVEFKSSLRYNLHSKKFGKEIEHATLKTIAAFLNSEGGTLLIGVDDAQGIIGIEADNFENNDKALLHFTNLVKERIGMQYMSFIDCIIEAIDDKKILRIDVASSNIPAYLTYNQQEYFFIRTGPATSDLRASEIYDFVQHRFYAPK